MTYATLNSGAKMPQPALGVYKMTDPARGLEAMLGAIEIGYRHLDTAAFYDNEETVGRAVRECGVPREELFVTTKMWIDDIRAHRQTEAFEESCRKLGLDYLDLYLVHWPLDGLVEETWEAMERILLTGRVKSIGVSNHRVEDLRAILRMGGTVPAVNQVECQPYFAQTEMLDFCAEHNIHMQAWAPFGANKAPILQDPVLAAIADKHGKSAAQVVVRWNLERGVTPLPKSENPDRQRANLDVFDFALDDADMAAIASLDSGRRLGIDPSEIAAQE